ncbi:hypothetical protein JG687_00000434 [Phytophthora cactorum]|uniref:Uncharacterized protein n=1 Tax=Phytophthora cactorum TaxID=29920 RepID=A0A8T1V2Q2_9STRA|nr:hypothetical protein JG687_00000434 [Phytophthora cactorum]
MLTVKLANKEKEVEMLRCKQNVVDQQFAGHDRQLQQQQEENARVVSEMTATNQELQRQVQLLQIQCEQKCKGVKEVSRKLEEEKFALEEKQRAWMKTLKAASSRAADMEKKRSELAQLTEQLAAFKKENGELKARRGQMSSQTKHLQARIAALESANTVQEKKLEDAATELESARKYGRDYQFRIKQLQEEIVFLKNRKPAANSSAVATGNSSPPDVQTAAPETDPADDMPCWMKG